MMSTCLTRIVMISMMLMSSVMGFCQEEQAMAAPSVIDSLQAVNDSIVLSLNNQIQELKLQGIMMQEQLERTGKSAKGGVLMIDEAYLLNPPHPNDPGKHVLQLMMPVLADEKMRDIAIVLCGYSEPMERLLNLNDGLASRFPNRFKFPEFSVDQLLDISKQRVKTFNYHFTPKAWKLYKEVVTRVYEHRDKRTWSNAREVAQLLEKIYIHHANRCMTAPDPKKVLAITVADIRPLVTSFSFTPQHRIGFR